MLPECPLSVGRSGEKETKKATKKNLTDARRSLRSDYSNKFNSKLVYLVRAIWKETKLVVFFSSSLNLKTTCPRSKYVFVSYKHNKSSTIICVSYFLVVIFGETFKHNRLKDEKKNLRLKSFQLFDFNCNTNLSRLRINCIIIFS